MAAEKTVLGHIDCPACGWEGGMRITADKNGDPFGFCEASCNAQLRIGGNARRVAAFIQIHPWAAGPVTVPVPEENRKPEPEPEPEKKPKPEPRKGFAFGL